MTLQDELDSFKSRKLPEKTIFSSPFRNHLWREGQRTHSPSRIMRFTDKLPQYERLMFKINEANKMVMDLARSFMGKPLRRNYDDYAHCEFYKCKFYGNTIERRIHVKNVHTSHDCHLSPEDSCSGCEAIN